jgi:hypothetical protein
MVVLRWCLNRKNQQAFEIPRAGRFALDRMIKSIAVLIPFNTENQPLEFLELHVYGVLKVMRAIKSEQRRDRYEKICFLTDSYLPPFSARGTFDILEDEQDPQVHAIRLTV